MHLAMWACTGWRLNESTLQFSRDFFAMRYVLVAAYFAVMGFAMGKFHTSLDYIHCESFTKNGVMWTGYVSMKDGDIRCFWKEERYPWRLMQGVPVN